MTLLLTKTSAGFSATLAELRYQVISSEIVKSAKIWLLWMKLNIYCIPFSKSMNLVINKEK